jgi:hypothetical protein
MKKFKSCRLFGGVVILVSMILTSSHLNAATVIWDNSPSTSGIQDGSGVWRATGTPNSRWLLGATNVLWTNTSPYDAIIGNGGTAGVIDLDMVAVANSLTFNTVTGNYLINGLAGSSLTINGGGILANWSATIATSVILGANQTWSVASGQSLKFTQVISGSGTLDKAGTGILDLQGSSINSGSMTVSAGILLANNTTGSATGTGGINVLSGGVIGGSGFIVGSVVLQSGAAASPGSPGVSGGIGKLTINNTLTAGAGSLLEFHVGSTGAYDQLVVNGTLAVTPTTIARVIIDAGYTPVYGTTFNLLDWTTLSFPGSNLATTLDLPILTGGFSWYVNNFHSQGTIIIVPEPSKKMLVAGGLLVILLRRRRPGC